MKPVLTLKMCQYGLILTINITGLTVFLFSGKVLLLLDIFAALFGIASNFLGA